VDNKKALLSFNKDDNAVYVLVVVPPLFAALSDWDNAASSSPNNGGSR
jgi:hypothetical protein